MDNNSILKIKQLEKEYTIILNQYEEAYKNYVNSKNDKNFVSLKGKTWWGKNPLKQNVVSSKDDCITMCASDSKCSGATYNESNRFCWTRMGESNLNNGKEVEYALITNTKSNIINLDLLNKKLLELNKEIIDEFNKIDIENIDINQEQTKTELNDNYLKLLNEQEDIKGLIDSYNNIQSNLDNQELFVEQSNASLRIWVLITMVILLVTITQFIGIDYIPTSIIIKLIIVIVLIVLTFNLNSRGGFMLVLLFLLVQILMIIGIIPHSVFSLF